MYTRKPLGYDTPDPKPIRELIKQHRLQSIVNKAHWLIHVEQTLLKILPAELASVRVMNVTEDTLVLEVQNAGLATRVRFEEPSILFGLCQVLPECNGLRHVKCRIRPS